MFTSSSQVENHHHHHHHHHQFFPYPLVPRPVVGDHNQRRWKPNVEIAPNCPRCNSSNTKFCYYNNYSLTQPRYFCKGCRRYWTKGGSLRNVPVGGGCRKSRRAKAVRSDNLRHHHRVSTTTTTNYGPNSMGLGVSHDDASVNANSTNMNDNLNESNSCEPCNIDLALVYAKFLNQRPDYTTSNPNPNDHDHQHVISEFARDDNQFNSTSSNITTSSSVWEPNHNLDAHVQRFSQEQEFGNSSTDHEFNGHIEGKDQYQILVSKEFDLNYDQQPQERIKSQTSAGFDEECSYALQPQELINGQDMFWSNSPLMGSSSFPWPPHFYPFVFPFRAPLIIFFVAFSSSSSSPSHLLHRSRFSLSLAFARCSLSLSLRFAFALSLLASLSSHLLHRAFSPRSLLSSSSSPLALCALIFFFIAALASLALSSSSSPPPLLASPLALSSSSSPPPSLFALRSSSSSSRLLRSLASLIFIFASLSHLLLHRPLIIFFFIALRSLSSSSSPTTLSSSSSRPFIFFIALTEKSLQSSLLGGLPLPLQQLSCSSLFFLTKSVTTSSYFHRFDFLGISVLCTNQHLCSLH
ncbi:hypothetical protein Sjap_012514 [Stephania japonica]|uniref:Dof zinc finger protein n=1 Tax=Stephania japonica TaxID=461633 RepID=A0AAP0IY39_9MAGN